jgi:NAD(P)-dependent dehydrogenase (short-subunit alcohol dehydrogenase family)
MEMQSLSQLMDLGSKVAIVTGGAMGIGQGIVLRLAEAGASVLIADIDIEAARKTVEQITRAGGRAEAIKAEAGSVSDAERVAQTAMTTFGRLDILVNNAGIYPPSAIMQISEALWDKVLDINLKGLFFYSQAAARKMIEAGRGGKIVNIASAGAIIPTGFLAHYEASKGGVMAITRALAKELGQHQILVNSIAPGGVPTPGGREAAAVMQASLNISEDATPPPRSVLGRWGTPDDIGKVVCFLASGLADYMTGSLVVVDGGYLLI